ncbi:hypothetical protein [Edaphovirga cremea]|nr:hypothetical protein [Edaphovirga cremea]
MSESVYQSAFVFAFNSHHKCFWLALILALVRLGAMIYYNTLLF